MIDTVAVLTLPRLGFNDFWGNAFEALIGAGITQICKTTGAFWDARITQAMENALSHQPKWLLMLDSDTIFTADDVLHLRRLADDYQPDALAALQMHRMQNRPLFSVRDDEGNLKSHITDGDVQHDVLRVYTAHLGMTLLNVKKLSTLAKPWFWAQPDAQGEWGPGSVAADTWFWQQWERAGHDVYVAIHLPVGHLEAHVRWPNRDLQTTVQHVQDFTDHGKPESIWK